MNSMEHEKLTEFNGTQNISQNLQKSENVPFQGRIQTGSKGSDKPVKQFRFFLKNIKIYYQIPDHKKEFDFLM